MQNSEYNKQYKINMQNLFLDTEKSILDYDAEKINTREFGANFKSKEKMYSDELDNVKDFYNKLEMDARRYNRNFDSRNGAVIG